MTRRPRHRFLSVVLTAVLTALLAGVTAILLPGTASAHASLENSSPAIGAELAEAPTQIVLVFNEGIRDFAPQIAITVGDQAPVSVTPTVDVDTVTADLVGVDIPRDPNSALWKVGFRVVSEDGHPIAGVMEFSVLDDGATGGSGQSNGPNSNFETGGAETTDAGTPVTEATEQTVDTSDEATMTILSESSTAAPSDVAAESGDGHSTGSMVAWFIGGGVLIVAIIVVAVVAARRRPTAPTGGGSGD